MTELVGVVFNQINIVARDWDATVAFYRLLGLELGASGEWPPGSGGRHEAVLANGVGTALEVDSVPMFRLYADDAPDMPACIIGLAFSASEMVDAVVERLVAAGHTPRRAPYDAFWGARYAIVEDPNGNTIGLMGPRDRSRGYVPGSA